MSRSHRPRRTFTRTTPTPTRTSSSVTCRPRRRRSSAARPAPPARMPMPARGFPCSRATGAMWRSSPRRRTSTPPTATRHRRLRPRPADLDDDARQPRERCRQARRATATPTTRWSRRMARTPRSARTRRTSARPTADAIADVYVRNLQTSTTTLASRRTGAGGTKGNANSFVPHAVGRRAHRRVHLGGHQHRLGRRRQPSSTCTCAICRPRQRLLISRRSGTAGTKGTATSWFPEISANGRYVAFYTKGTLDPADSDTNQDVFMRDLQTAATVLVSRAAGATGEKGDFDSYFPEISADGRFVTFESAATNFDPADTDATVDIYLRDVLGPPRRRLRRRHHLRRRRHLPRRHHHLRLPPADAGTGRRRNPASTPPAPPSHRRPRSGPPLPTPTTTGSPTASTPARASDPASPTRIATAAATTSASAAASRCIRRSTCAS